MAGRAVVLRIEPPAASRPCRASIVPSLRSADASGPASSFGPARLRLPCGRRGSPLPCAIKARRAVSSASPAGRTNPALFSLTAPVRALLTVAGDELRKDGGNRANRVPRADRTEQPKGWAPNLGIRCAV
ncbi:hypothetical protein G6F22_017677 [Rhizopus arrhizus]|nr:hypothetical protein G6F22_017677 [Rhizopus arrhizus]